MFGLKRINILRDSTPDNIPQDAKQRRAALTFVGTRFDGRIHPALDTKSQPYAIMNEGKTAVHLVNEAGLKQLQEYENIKLKNSPSLDYDAIYESTRIAKSRFAHVMKEILGVDVDASDLDSVLRALEKKTAGTSGGQSRIQKLCWRFCDVAGSAKNITTLLPSQSTYGSVLCGGIALVLQAAVNLKSMRDDMLMALEDIPHVLEPARDSVALYPNDEALHRAASELYVSIFKLLEYVLCWIGKRLDKKGLDALFKQDTYTQDLASKRQQMQRKKEYFNERLAVSQRIILVDFCAEFERSRQKNDELVAKVESMRVEWQADREEYKHATATQQNLMNELAARVVDNHAANKREQASQPESAKVESYLSSEYILGSLSFTLEDVAPDLTELSWLSYDLSFADQGRSAALMLNQEFGDWAANSSSSVLLVNGNSEDSLQSSLTVTCANLMDAIRTRTLGSGEGIIPLCFFCGEHRMGSSEAHAKGMMLNLMAQLVHWHRDFEFASVEGLWGQLFPNDLKSICKFFKALVKQLPSTEMIFCVIDGISHFEDSSRRIDTEVAVRRLLRLVQGKDGPVIKLLLTSPSTSLYLRRYFADDEVLDMQDEHCDLGDSRYLAWEEGIGKSMETLNVW